MKKTLCLLLSSVVLLSAVAQKDEDAIKKVINDETTAFYANDAKAMLSFWHVTPQSTLFVGINPDQALSIQSTGMVVDSVSKHMPGEPITVDFARSNWVFSMHGDIAYVTFEQSRADEKTYSHETRFMEKVNGDWKIVSSNVVILNKK